ncbi:hypothetical protein CC85DRAFT_35323 [Cutaneotrichosporon oleaginosum]|uniref:Uncharacterized protein n=1 Tax=Cutaneotrichosporon oleaginosum TaxID=879819 RepID=A0A0J1B845_9TREE|nr:uncharacterized protein CC85DRAFT_35323 [Cutaneotrichosporon oleaginosum]KLT43939.1 hypothetical protein CC85DRAFT_35323 [Cutaneotrichosporon oleaginosum]TXT04114.1 hypothetical protein COLE_07811 [Cutaneotrichosporon oleaginosum]
MQAMHALRSRTGICSRLQNKRDAWRCRGQCALTERHTRSTLPPYLHIRTIRTIRIASASLNSLSIKRSSDSSLGRSCMHDIPPRRVSRQYSSGQACQPRGMWRWTAFHLQLGCGGVSIPHSSHSLCNSWLETNHVSRAGSLESELGRLVGR